MRYWLGAALFAIAAFLAWRAWSHRSAVLALAPRDAVLRRQQLAADDPRSLAAMGEISRPLVVGLLAWTGLKTTAAFAMLDAARYFAWFDLAGFLGLLVGYGTLFHVQTRYRLADARAVREAAAGAAVVESRAATRPAEGEAVHAEPAAGATNGAARAAA